MIEQMGEQIIKWCRKEYGKRRHRPVPKIIYLSLPHLGEYDYDNNQIRIDLKKHIIEEGQLNLHEFIDTVIHEYQHYMQDWRKVYGDVVKKMEGKLEIDYFEDRAEGVAERDFLSCYKQVIKKIN